MHLPKTRKNEISLTNRIHEGIQKEKKKEKYLERIEMFFEQFEGISDGDKAMELRSVAFGVMKACERIRRGGGRGRRMVESQNRMDGFVQLRVEVRGSS